MGSKKKSSAPTSSSTTGGGHPLTCDCKKCRFYKANKKLKRALKHCQHGTRASAYGDKYGVSKVLSYAADIAANYINSKIIADPNNALTYGALAAIKSRL